MLLGAALPLAGCAAPASYAGIPLEAGAADPELQSLARRADAGDKHAQLELGIRYEEGRRVPLDRKRAERLYRLAAADEVGRIYVYTPAVHPGGRGRVLSLRSGRREPGLREAARRLAALNARNGS